MKIELTGRNMNITPALRKHVGERLTQSSSALGSIREVHVILAAEKHRHVAEIVVHRPRGLLSGRATSRDMYQSIQKAIDRIETQVTRTRERLIATKRRGAHVKERAQRAAAGDEAIPMTAPLPAETLIPRLIEEPLDRVKPITVEEALLLLDEASRPFVAFRDSGTGAIAIIYRRTDGHYGLVLEPRS